MRGCAAVRPGARTPLPGGVAANLGDRYLGIREMRCGKDNIRQAATPFRREATPFRRAAVILMNYKTLPRLRVYIFTLLYVYQSVGRSDNINIGLGLCIGFGLGCFSL